jgi:hypothetical protein
MLNDKVYSRFCGYLNICSYSNIWSHFVIFNYSKFTYPNQMIEQKTNHCHVNNKYRNWMDNYKYAIN